MLIAFLSFVAFLICFAVICFVILNKIAKNINVVSEKKYTEKQMRIQKEKEENERLMQEEIAERKRLNDLYIEREAEKAKKKQEADEKKRKRLEKEKEENKKRWEENNKAENVFKSKISTEKEIEKTNIKKKLQELEITNLVSKEWLDKTY
jgi:hypothetical protein